MSFLQLLSLLGSAPRTVPLRLRFQCKLPSPFYFPSHLMLIL